ncbi:uncharacterized protein LOC112872546 isoform X2 [Panicum hallii]|uniref:uncharacterized protein LOC112872546 isoform X2 n=1 Tax=Panicum hallii TaxID=206008 RepID=UPI000DF4EE81|nr:uncharacterized protein LOC112872546 isoform X2 [Panicum hallii]
MDPSSWSLARVGARPVWTHMHEAVVCWFPVSTRENHRCRGSQMLGIERKKKGGCRDRRPVAVTKMPRDGLARDLEVEAALAAEAAWGLKEAVASMAWSIDMDVYSPLHLPTELVGNGSISANKVWNRCHLKGTSKRDHLWQLRHQIFSMIISCLQFRREEKELGLEPF